MSEQDADREHRCPHCGAVLTANYEALDTRVHDDGVVELKFVCRNCQEPYWVEMIPGVSM